MRARREAQEATFRPRMRRPNVLVVYVLRQHPLRATIRDHLYSFERYSDGRTAYLNLAVRRRVPAWVRRVPWDLVVFHTSYLATYRWTPDGAPWLRRRSQALRGVGRVRVALPQDDFLRSDLVAEVMEELGVDHVFTPVPASEHAKVYGRMDLDRVRFHLALTGYLDDDEVARMIAIAEEVDHGPGPGATSTSAIAPGTRRSGSDATAS